MESVEATTRRRPRSSNKLVARAVVSFGEGVVGLPPGHLVLSGLVNRPIPAPRNLQSKLEFAILFEIGAVCEAVQEGGNQIEAGQKANCRKIYQE